MRPVSATVRARFAPRAVALAAPFAVLAASLATAAFQLDRGAAATTAWLGWTVAGCLALLALAGAGVHHVAIAALALGGALIALPHAGVLRPAVVTALALTAVAALATQALRRRAGAALPGRLAIWLAITLAGELLVRSDLLWRGPTAPTSLVALLLAPALAAAGLAALDGVVPGAARVAALGAFIAGPGFAPESAATLAVAAALARGPLAARPRAGALVAVLSPVVPLALGPEPFWVAIALGGLAALALAGATIAPAYPPGETRLAGWALVALSVWALGTGALAALPWQRERPAELFLEALTGPYARVVERPVERQPVVLSAASPRWTAPLAGTSVSRIVLDSYLTNSTALPCGTVVARLRLAAEDAAASEFALVIGRDSAEWAAERPDVASSLACPAPVAWSSWTPAQGRFLGHHYRARLTLDRPLAARHLVLERPGSLPDELGFAVFHLATER